MKLISQLNENNYFIGITEADVSPLEPNVYLITRNAIDVSPPNIPEGKKAKWNNNEWIFEDIAQPVNMTITYTKVIDSLTCYAEIDNETDVVFTINWTLNGNEGVLYAGYPCTTSVPFTAGETFVPYADLTEQQVLDWIEEYTDPEIMASYYQYIYNSIEQQKLVVTPPLPWIPPLP